MLEMIAPLAIMAYIDPKVNLDTDTTFTARYVKLYIKTYLELFTWLATISVVMLALGSLNELAIFKASPLGGIIIIIALLKGMNDIPPMIIGMIGGAAAAESAGGMGFLGKAGGAVTGGITGSIGGAAKGLIHGGLKGAGAGALTGMAAGSKDGFENDRSFEADNKAKGKAEYMSGFGVGANSTNTKGNISRAADAANKGLTSKGNKLAGDAAQNKTKEGKVAKLRGSGITAGQVARRNRRADKIEDRANENFFEQTAAENVSSIYNAEHPQPSAEQRTATAAAQTAAAGERTATAAEQTAAATEQIRDEVVPPPRP